jgi:hypothetical protein
MYIPTQSQVNTILKVINSPSFQKWVGRPLTFFELQDEIYDGGREYCESMIEFLYEAQPYGYRQAIEAFENIIYVAENRRY